jgi:hypothetical protein
MHKEAVRAGCTWPPQPRRSLQGSHRLRPVSAIRTQHDGQQLVLALILCYIIVADDVRKTSLCPDFCNIYCNGVPLDPTNPTYRQIESSSPHARAPSVESKTFGVLRAIILLATQCSVQTELCRDRKGRASPLGARHMLEYSGEHSSVGQCCTKRSVQGRDRNTSPARATCFSRISVPVLSAFSSNTVLPKRSETVPMSCPSTTRSQIEAQLRHSPPTGVQF